MDRGISDEQIQRAQQREKLFLTYLNSPEGKKFIEALQSSHHPLYPLLKSSDLPIQHEAPRTVFSIGTLSVEIRQFIEPDGYYMVRSEHSRWAEVIVRNPICVIHVGNGVEEFRDNSIGFIRQVQSDLSALCRMIMSNEPQSNFPGKDATRRGLQNSVIIGVSHLNELLTKLTNVEGWSLERFDKSVQDFFVGDSQAVIDRFGGSREATSENVLVLCVAPSVLLDALQKRS